MGAILAACWSVLRKIPLKFYLWAAIAAFIAYLMWREHSLTRKNAALQAEKAELVIERDQAIETAQRQEKASNAYQRSLTALRVGRAGIPTRTVRLCLAPRVPEATGGHDAAGSEELSEAVGPDHPAGPVAGVDIGAELYELLDEADQCAAQRDALIDWYE